MKNIIPLLVLVFCLNACKSEKKISADLLVHNAKVYTVDSAFSTIEAFVVKDGKFLETGSSEDLKLKYEATRTLDAGGNAIYPGLIDAHAHFYGLGQQQQNVDVSGTTSFDEVVTRIVEFQKNKSKEYIIGRGWDQNDWEIKEFPIKDTLDILFPDTPVAITRIDGHAMLVNQAALDKAGIDMNTQFSGGDIERKNGQLTGILIDNPMELVENSFPQANINDNIGALLDAQELCLEYGLTTVVDAGLDREIIELMDSLHRSNELKIRIYAMLSNTKENLDHYLKKEPIKTKRLHVSSVKFYGDGALGSRGAALKEPYHDNPGHYGTLLSPISEFRAVAERVLDSKFQLNTHAIGDSANFVVLETYSDLLKDQENRRWRVEHSQVIDTSDFKLFSKNIIPSVQPTHATSDMYWAEDRLGEDRIKGAYAYKDLLDQAGIIALGTDFPIEKVSPFLTFYAAVHRRDLSNYPEEGFEIVQALSREEALKGMTIWAAYANFEDQEKGSIEAGKLADFMMLDADIMEVDVKQIPSLKVLETYVNGEMVYKK